MSNFYTLGVNDNNSYYVHASNNLSASVAKYMGKHSLKIGFDYRRIKAAGNDANNAAGDYTFNGIFTRSNNTSKGAGGADIADMLLGYPSAGNIYTSTKLTQFADYYGVYIQDDFRVSSKLTLNVGLRWEHETGLQEQNNGLLVGFNGTAVNPLGTERRRPVRGQRRYHSRQSISEQMGPALRLCIQARRQDSFRGGYGLFWAPQFAIGSPIATVGYNQATQYIASTDNFLTASSSLAILFQAAFYSQRA